MQSSSADPSTPAPAPPHVIRLRRAWQYEALARTVLLPDGTTRAVPGQLPPPGRIDVPADWGQTLGPDFRGRVLYRRRFGRPAGLAASDRVDLVIERVDAFGRCWLNAAPLGKIDLSGQPLRADITAILKPRNLLEVLVELPRLTAQSPPLPRGPRENRPGGLIGPVRIEIFPGGRQRLS